MQLNSKYQAYFEVKQSLLIQIIPVPLRLLQ